MVSYFRLMMKLVVVLVLCLALVNNYGVLGVHDVLGVVEVDSVGVVVVHVVDKSFVVVVVVVDKIVVVVVVVVVVVDSIVVVVVDKIVVVVVLLVMQLDCNKFESIVVMIVLEKQIDWHQIRRID